MFFVFPNNNSCVSIYKIVIAIGEKCCQYLSLPEKIQVYFEDMKSNGETILTYRPQATIILNSNLTAKELFYPTIHELVHIHQIHTKRLSVTRTGVYVWDHQTYVVDPKAMSYQEYRNLPWEVDAFEQQELIGKKILNNM